MRIAIWLGVLYLTLGSRFMVSAGPGRLSVFALAFIAAAACLFLSDELRREPAKPYRAVAINTVGPLFAALIVLPLVGILVGWYGWSIIYGWTIVLIPLALVSMGRAARLRNYDLGPAVFVAILAHGVYGLGQMFYRLDLMPAGLWSWAAEWDTRVQLEASAEYLIVGRSTGLFINANQFGLWSCLAVIFASGAMTGKRRNIAMALGVLGVVASQSRTAWACLAVLVLLVVVAAFRSGHVASRALVVIFWAVPAVLIAWLTGALHRVIEGDLVERLASALAATQDVEADRNLSARVDSWGEAVDFSSQYPFGTLGPPQALYGQFIDNQFVSLYLQGGVPLVLAYALALLGPFVLRRRGVPGWGAVAVATAVVFVASWTMQPVDTPQSGALLWLTVAAAFSVAPEVRARSDREPGALSAGRSRASASSLRRSPLRAYRSGA